MPAVQKVSVVDAFSYGLLLLLAVLAVVLAWRNFRTGRGDIRSAGRLAAFFLGLEMLQWLCTGHHFAGPGEVAVFLSGIMWYGLDAVLTGAIYLALEPYVRRRWPQSIVSWSRLLSGRFRDPLVGGHMLIGIAFGVGVTCLFLLQDYLLAHFGSLARYLDPDSVLDTRRMLGEFLFLTPWGAFFALVGFLELFLLRVLLRRQWLAVVAVLLLNTAPSLALDHAAIYASGQLIVTGLAVFMLIRFGVLAFAVVATIGFSLPAFPLSTNFSTWYAGSGIFALAVVLALTAYAFHTAIAGRPVFTAGFLERD